MFWRKSKLICNCGSLRNTVFTIDCWRAIILAMKTFYEQTNVMKIYLHRKKSSSPPALSLYFHLFQIVLDSIIVSMLIGAIGSMAS